MAGTWNNALTIISHSNPSQPTEIKKKILVLITMYTVAETTDRRLVRPMEHFAYIKF